jgi:cytochrome c oxidase subunit II
MKIDNTLVAAILLIVVGVFGLTFINDFGSYRGQYDPMNLMGQGMMEGMMGTSTTKTTFSSNGERIYYTAASDSGEPIAFTMGMMEMTSPLMSCVNCHGEDGRGGIVQMMGMMGGFEAPDIRYKALTAEEHGDEGEDHPPYTDELLRRAITKGINPAGESLEPPMPQWSMSEGDLNDLIDYLKTLE